MGGRHVIGRPCFLVRKIGSLPCYPWNGTADPLLPSITGGLKKDFGDFAYPLLHLSCPLFPFRLMVLAVRRYLRWNFSTTLWAISISNLVCFKIIRLHYVFFAACNILSPLLKIFKWEYNCMKNESCFIYFLVEFSWWLLLLYMKSSLSCFQRLLFPSLNSGYRF